MEATVNAYTTSISNQDKARFLRSIMALKVLYPKSPMAVYCVLGRKFRAIFGRQGPAIQTELTLEKQALGSRDPVQFPEGGCV